MVRMVSISPGEGPGPVISRGFIERRVFKSSIASGTACSFARVSLQVHKRARAQAEATLDRLWLGYRRQLCPLDVRRRGFVHQGGDRLLPRHHLLALAAEPADRDGV